MANTLNIIRDHARITVTPRDVGLTLTVEVTAYDSGVINVNGLPSLDYASTIRVLAGAARRHGEASQVGRPRPRQMG